MLVHDPVCIDDNIWKYFLTEQNSDYTSGYGCQQCVSEILARNRMSLIPQRLECPYLRPLLFHHTGHSRQTDKRSHKEKYRREHFSDSPHTVCILSVSGIIRQIGPVIYVPLGLLEIIDLVFRIRKLFFRIRDLLFSVCDLCFRLCFSLVIFFPAVRDLCFRLFKLRFCISEFLLSCSDLIPAAIDLFLPGFQFCLR